MQFEAVLAPNPGLFTGPGTNTWVASADGEAVVVDPGPLIRSHLEAVVAAVGDARPVALLVTHGHPDHAPGANPLAAELGVAAMGPAPAAGFNPDRLLADGDEVRLGTRTVRVVATPGHTADSTSYMVDDALFCGDHIMGGSTVVVEDMADYMRSLQRLDGLPLRALYPGHGPALHDPAAVIAEYRAHRLQREAQVLGAVDAGAGTVDAIVAAVYTDVDAALHSTAAVSVAAHVRKLADEGRVELGPTGEVRAVNR